MNIIYSFFASLLLIGDYTHAPIEDYAPFEGVITYKIEYMEVPDEVKGMESMLPQQMTMTVKGENTRIDQELMGGRQTVIANNTSKESHVLMDMMGQKIHIYISPEDAEKGKENAKEQDYEDLPGTKTILGYKCQQARVISGNTDSSQTIYYTKKLKSKHSNFKGLKGFPLQYDTNDNNMKLRMTATKVSETKISDSIFEVPEGYTTMSMDDMSKMMGGGE